MELIRGRLVFCGKAFVGDAAANERRELACLHLNSKRPNQVSRGHRTAHVNASLFITN